MEESERPSEVRCHTAATCQLASSSMVVKAPCAVTPQPWNDLHRTIQSPQSACGGPAWDLWSTILVARSCACCTCLLDLRHMLCFCADSSRRLVEFITPGLSGDAQRQLLFVDALPAVPVGGDLFAAANGGQFRARRLSAAPAPARITYTPGWKLYKVWF